jgi:Zn-dependent M16 (insulinase) family peptidase
LEIGLSDIPDETLDQDWHYLCHIIAADLAVSPDQVLDNIRDLLTAITHQDNMRSYIISSYSTYLELEEVFFSLVTSFSDKQTVIHSYNTLPSITRQMQNRYPHIKKPVYVGLVNNSSSSGVHINTAPCASFMDSDPEILLDFLAARIYGGHGAHSMFMQTWGAGLAYSNGLRSNEYSGNLLYYAERCPDLTQTMQFVIQTLNRAPYDTALAEYAVSQAFSVSRAGDRYEARGRNMATDLADGLSPEIVERFRKEIMKLRGEPNFYDKLYNRMEDVYGRVLPGYGSNGNDMRGVLYFMIAPEDMLKSYASYLKNIEENSELYLLYPRDYWLKFEN